MRDQNCFTYDHVYTWMVTIRGESRMLIDWYLGCLLTGAQLAIKCKQSKDGLELGFLSVHNTTFPPVLTTFLCFHTKIII